MVGENKIFILEKGVSLTVTYPLSPQPQILNNLNQKSKKIIDELSNSKHGVDLC